MIKFVQSVLESNTDWTIEGADGMDVTRKTVVYRGNIFDLPSPPGSDETEWSQPLFPDSGALVERIVSTGQTTPEGQWYNQERDEWVTLLRGKAVLLWEDGREEAMAAGDWVLIPAHYRHRVIKTSIEPPCLWLAVHARFLPQS